MIDATILPNPNVIASADCWRDEDVLVLRREGKAPFRCIKCNAPAELLPKPYGVSWHHPGYYAFLLFYIWAYFFIALLVQQKATVNIAVCEKHRARRKWMIGFGCGSCLLGLAMFGIGQSTSIETVTLIGWPLLIIGIVIAFLARFVRAIEIKTDTVKLRGCGKEFLASLPEAH